MKDMEIFVELTAEEAEAINGGNSNQLHIWGGNSDFRQWLRGTKGSTIASGGAALLPLPRPEPRPTSGPTPTPTPNQSFQDLW